MVVEFSPLQIWLSSEKSAGSSPLFSVPSVSRRSGARFTKNLRSP